MTKAPELAKPQALQCMEIWGGNRAVEQSVSTPGLDIWVYSRPYEQATQGGDVYYTSLCSGGLITRFILADVSGHGQTVSEVGQSLRNLMRKHINAKSQKRLVQSLNREFTELAQQNRFATAVVATYLTTGKRLTVSNAGHPRPFYYRAAEQTWTILQEQPQENAKGLSNLPLGIVEETAYTQMEILLEPGDYILFYTDAFPETCNPSGEALGEQGFLQIVQRLHTADPEHMAPELIAQIDAFRGDRPTEDDVTFVLLHHNAQEPARQSLREKLNVYAKMFGLKSV